MSIQTQEVTAIIPFRPRRPRPTVAWRDILLTAAAVMAAIGWAAMP